MATHTTSTAIGLFENRAAAERAIDALLKEGFSHSHVSVVAGDSRSPADDVPNLSTVDSQGSFDAGTGAAWGGLAGFVGGILALAIPGIGPILAAGPLAAGVMGATVGVAAGGLIGGLKEHGVPENDAARVSEAIRSGKVMVAVHALDEQISKAADILDDHGAVDTQEVEGDATGNRGTVTPMTPPSASALEGLRLKDGEGLVDRERERSRRSQVYPGITGGGTTPNS
ncbi:MAG: hypothetical protein H7039_14765 [Bryobacteraceae bacterium]|nr:hypothetical protein [Bryobacteraceae bacterium]